MRIKLYPQELGAIEISLVNKHNGVDVVLVAEQASTQRLLESQSEQLRQALSNSGVQLADLQISQEGFKDQQAGFFEQKNNRKWLKGLPDQAAGKITGTTAVGSLSLHHSVIDYLI
jgi:flagellar hook-length control protein FliK